MLSLLRWTLGTGNDHLTEPEKVKVAEKSNSRPRPPKTRAMPANPAKRKRGDSAHTAGSQLRHVPTPAAPTPAAPTPSAPSRAPQYLSHVEVAVQNAKNAVARRPSSVSPAAVMTHNATNVARNGYFPTYQPAERLDAMDWQVAAAPSAPPRGSALPPKSTKPPAQPAVADPVVSAAAAEAAKMTELQQAIETEFDLEILLKHDELRLIDQEIAKCQVALEQLRRCSVIPYPSQTAEPDDMAAVSAGAGSPLRRRSGGQPESAPPWGVVDGPYSRHYARWLLPDPVFDGASAGHEPSLSSAAKLADAKHRAVGAAARAEKSVPSPKARPHRGSGALRLQALPAGYPEPKEAKGPMVLRRAADGKLVKLVCVDCHREDFSSPQGFINHCRIAHGRNLPSHEAAAQVCGQEIEANAVDAAAGVGGEAGGAVASTPVTAGPAVGTPVTAGSALVHPFIKNSHLPARVPMLSKPPPPRIPAHSATATVFSASIPPNHSNKPDAPFVPSAQAPHLSHLLAQAGGRGVDLQALIAEATTHENLDAVASESDYEEEEDGGDDDDAMETDDSHPDRSPNPPSTFRPAHPARQPSRGVRGGPTTHPPAPPPPDTPDARDTGRKGPERATRRPGGMRVAAAPRPPLAATAAATAEPSSSATAAAPASTPPAATAAASLSPHTAPSAPSLVSDRGDDDDDEDYASRATHTSGGGSSSDVAANDDAGEDEMDVDIDMRSAGASTAEGDEAGASDAVAPAAPRRGGGRAMRRGAEPDPELSASGKAREQGRRRAVGRGRGGRRRGGK